MQPTIETTVPVHRPSVLRDWVKTLRVRQWAKNLVVFAGLLFTGTFLELHSLLLSFGAFFCFCALSSVGYLINDVLDAERDRHHPTKCHRPIAAGRIRPWTAISAAGILLVAALAGSWFVRPLFTLVSVAYLVVTLSYSLYWKHQVLLDLISITAGFLLRAVAGTVALAVVVSPWLLVCISLLALLLGLGKRRGELVLLEQSGKIHRPVLADYSRLFLDQSVTMVAASSLCAYSVYAISSPTAHSHPHLVYSVPFVIFIILRYTYLVFHHDLGSQPEEILLTDRPMVLTIAMWTAVVIAVFLMGGQ